MDMINDTILCGLQKWFVHTFEKAGWIVLSHYKSDKNIAYLKKVDSYVTGIDKLLEDIQQRVQNPRGNGIITRDFSTMHSKLVHLKNYMMDLKNVEPLDSPGNNLSIDDMSLQWMKQKYHHMFEKFGWMVLVKLQLDSAHYSSKPDLENVMKLKLNMYNQWIDVLLQSIKHRIETSNDIDSENLKHDLQVMHNNLKILNGAIKNLLTRNIKYINDIDFNDIDFNSNTLTKKTNINNFIGINGGNRDNGDNGDNGDNDTSNSLLLSLFN